MRRSFESFFSSSGCGLGLPCFAPLVSSQSLSGQACIVKRDAMCRSQPEVYRRLALALLQLDDSFHQTLPVDVPIW